MLPIDGARTIIVSGEINEDLIASLMPSILELKDDANLPIYIIINTIGGDMHSMFALHDLLKALPNPLYTIGLGSVQSCGALLLALGDRRYVSANTICMLHEPCFYSSQGATLKVFKSELDINDFIRNKMLTLLSQYVKKQLNQIECDLSAGDKYFTAQAAIDYGLADEIIKDIS